MGTPRETPYITRHLPFVGGFRPSQVITYANGKYYKPRKPGKWISNVQWLQNEIERMRQAGIICYMEEIKSAGLTMFAIREGVKDEIKETQSQL